jgi:alpha-mannosidase
MTCDVAGNDLKASYEIPYATIQRPTDGKECVALKSADLSNADGGITLVNDCKSGHTAEGNTLRISLLRASYEPDRMADQREHFINMALAPHSGPYGAQQVKRGFEFNQEFVGERVPPSSNGSLPLEKSFVLVAGDNVVSTVLKRGEDDAKSMLVRFYEANGTASPVTISADTPVAATRWVNFVEDPLSTVSSSTVTSANLHKYEIRNLMLYREKPQTAAAPAKVRTKVAKAATKR